MTNLLLLVIPMPMPGTDKWILFCVLLISLINVVCADLVYYSRTLVYK